MILSEKDDRAISLNQMSRTASIATRPRVAARSPISGASWWAAQADACGRETLIRP
jgi:hypothetical protein